MRKIVVGEFISLDGVVEAPERWHFPYVNEEMMAVIGSLASTSDTMLLGRVTYESFAGFANAPAGDPTAAAMNRPEKVVVSKTLTELGWAKSTLLPDGDTVEQIAKLKEQPGGDILTTGSISLVQAMLTAGLVDEIDLLVHPIVLGAGLRLFADGVRIPLELAKCEVFGTGVTHQVYRKAA